MRRERNYSKRLTFKCLGGVYLINGAAFWKNASICVCHIDEDLVSFNKIFSPMDWLEDPLYFNIDTEGGRGIVALTLQGNLCVCVCV